jgi:hypothetical protein
VTVQLLSPPPVGSPPAFLTLGELDADEERTRQALVSQLRRAQLKNVRQTAFYEGSRRVRDLGIAIPPHLTQLESVAGWPEIIVDVIDERMNWLGWRERSDLGLQKVYDDNHLDIEVGQSVLNSLIHGLAFISVGTGGDDEPEVLVRSESSNRVTGVWDARVRRLKVALVETQDSRGDLSGWKLYKPDQTVTAERRNGRLVVVDRDEHDRGRVPIAVLLNRPWSERAYGRSEITKAVRSFTESGMRTLLGMEVAREFYGAPQRYLMGADERMFVDQDGNKKSMWDAVLGKMLAMPRDAAGDVPVAGEFSAANPLPFTEILRVLSQMISASSGVPSTHLGFTTDNPASADAIARADGRLDRRASRRGRMYNLGLDELGELIVLWRDGSLPETGLARSWWADPASPTPAATADEVVKLTAAMVNGVPIMPLRMARERLGWDAEQIRRAEEMDEEAPVDPMTVLNATLNGQAAGLPATATAAAPSVPATAPAASNGRQA